MFWLTSEHTSLIDIDVFLEEESERERLSPSRTLIQS